MASTAGFIFDLGTIDISENLINAPEFDGTEHKEIVGDVLLQFIWKNEGDAEDDAHNPGKTTVNQENKKVGNWKNLFLFNVDSSDISNVENEDIEYFTVKANWCGHSITRYCYDRWQNPAGRTANYLAGENAQEDGADASGALNKK